MSETSISQLMNTVCLSDFDSPWLGLLPFTEGTQRFFFGREAELREMFFRVRDHTLTILYGRSGLGKTSLIGAGLLPKLRADRFRPYLLRLSFGQADLPLLEQARAALASACADETTSVEGLLARWDQATLWECFHHIELRPDRLESAPPVLVFDQFEEMFTLGASQRPREEIASFARQLADLIENRVPVTVQDRLAQDPELSEVIDFGPSPLRLVIVLREDFLSHIENWKEFLPSLMRNRMGLGFLRGPQALEAIVRPGRLDGRNLISDEVGMQIVRVITRHGSETPLEEIDAVPPLLSLLCDELYRARGGAPTITVELVSQRHGNILQQFYARCFEGLPAEVRSFVEAEDYLVSGAGYRNSVSREDAQAKLGACGVLDPAAVLDTLQRRRLLSSEERGGVLRFEITHDILVPLVIESRDARRDLERIERADAERRKASAEAEKTRYEKTRLRRFALVAAFAAALALLGMIYGIRGWRLAEAATKDANEQRVSAQIATTKSEAQTRIAETQTRIAEKALEQKNEETLKKDNALKIKSQLLVEFARSDRLVAEELLESGNQLSAVAHLARTLKYDPDSAGIVAEKVIAELNLWSYPPPEYICSGHEGYVASAQFSPDGQHIVTASQDRTARIWDTHTGLQLLELTNHQDAVAMAAFSPNGLRIVTASLDKTARVWDAMTGRQLLTLTNHQEYVSHAAFSLDGLRIITASGDKTARVWDAMTGQQLVVLTNLGEVRMAAFSPDGRFIATASADTTARIWDSGSGEERHLVVDPEADPTPVDQVCFSPDGLRLVVVAANSTPSVWDPATGRRLFRLVEDKDGQTHSYRVWSAKFSPNGKRIVTCSGDHTAKVWDAESGSFLFTLKGHSASVPLVDYSADGRLIVTFARDGTVRLWDADAGYCLAIFQGHIGGSVRSVVFSPDSKRIVTSSNDKTARVWKTIENGDLIETWGYAELGVRGAFSPDGERIVTSSGDHTAQVWDARTGLLLVDFTNHLGGVYSTAFSFDGQRIVTVAYDKTARVWDARNGRQLVSMTNQHGGFTSAAFSFDGQRIVTTSGDKTARVWDARNGGQLVALTNHLDAVYTAEFSANDQRIVTASADSTARVWDAQSGKQLVVLENPDSVYSAAFSPDGHHIVVACLDNIARVWDAENGELETSLVGHKNFIASAKFSPDGRRVVTASGDKTAKIWDPNDGRLIATLKGHSERLKGAQYSSNGRLILTTSDDGSPKVWTVLPTGIAEPPDWFPDFLSYLSQRRFNSAGELEIISPDEVLTLAGRLRRVARAAVPQETAYLDVLRRFFSISSEK